MHARGGAGVRGRAISSMSRPRLTMETRGTTSLPTTTLVTNGATAALRLVLSRPPGGQKDQQRTPAARARPGERRAHHGACCADSAHSALSMPGLPARVGRARARQARAPEPRAGQRRPPQQATRQPACCACAQYLPAPLSLSRGRRRAAARGAVPGKRECKRMAMRAAAPAPRLCPVTTRRQPRQSSLRCTIAATRCPRRFLPPRPGPSLRACAPACDVGAAERASAGAPVSLTWLSWALAGRAGALTSHHRPMRGRVQQAPAPSKRACTPDAQPYPRLAAAGGGGGGGGGGPPPPAAPGQQRRARPSTGGGPGARGGGVVGGGGAHSAATSSAGSFPGPHSPSSLASSAGRMPLSSRSCRAHRTLGGATRGTARPAPRGCWDAHGHLCSKTQQIQ